MRSLVIENTMVPGLPKVFLAWLGDNSDGDTTAEVGDVGDPGPARGDKLDVDGLGGGVAREGLPVGHRVLLASGHVDHQLGSMGRWEQNEEEGQQGDHCRKVEKIISRFRGGSQIVIHISSRSHILLCYNLK